MLETVSATSTYIKTEGGTQSDPLAWDSQQFPDSNTDFIPIKQEILDPFDLNQTELIELKPIPFDYGSASLITSLDPILNNNNTIASNNNNSSSNNNNNGSLVNNNHHSSTKKMADLFINIKPLSPHDFGRSSSDSFPFHQSPSDVTSSGSMSPQGMTRIDFTTDQNAFDDLGNIVGLSVGADSTVPSLENDDVDLESLFETIKPLPLLPNSAAASSSDSGFDLHSSASLTTISTSDPVICSISSVGSLASSLSSTTLMMSTNNNNNNTSCHNTVSNNHQTLATSNNSQQQHPYIGSLSTLVKGSRMTIVEPRDSFPQNLSPILRGAITGTGYSHLTTTSTYPQIKFETMELLKQEYYHQQQEQMPHSTVTGLTEHRRLEAVGGMNGGPNAGIIRSKPKPHKIKQRSLPSNNGGGVSPQGGSGLGGGDLSKKMMHHCQICNRGFLNKSNIKVHMRTHTGEKPFGCDHCSKAFRQKAHLLKHMSIHKRISRD